MSRLICVDKMHLECGYGHGGACGFEAHTARVEAKCCVRT